MLLKKVILKKNINCFLALSKRNYQSEKGVFGYRPQPKREFKVDENVLQSRNAQSNIYRWIEAHRKYGHKLAAVNPICIAKKQNGQEGCLTELKPEYYGLKPQDTVKLEGLLNAQGLEMAGDEVTVDKMETLLKQIYCSSAVSAEFSYIENVEETEWLIKHFEELSSQSISNDAHKQIAELLIKAQAWENFMAMKFPTVKRYGGEGAESLLAFYWQLLQTAASEELQHIVVAMPHRGRTALQTILLNMRPAKVFHKLQGESEFRSDVQAMCDVISHFHTSEELKVNDKTIRFNLIRNPSHLEAANPVSMGKTRSKQQSTRDGAFSDDAEKRFATTALNVIVHGDAAFPGQGVNQECLNMAYVPHYEVGGSLHLIVNNQVGFTTPAQRGRSTDYSSDLAKTIQAPVFHVNGDNPEAVALVTDLALRYQREFRKDVFIDMNCFRRWGHNELDDPTFTNPSVYDIIHNRGSVPDLYAKELSAKGILSQKESEDIRNAFMEYLNKELAAAPAYQPAEAYFQRQWSGLKSAPDSITFWDTGLDYSILRHVGNQSVAFPKDFNIHPHLLKTHVQGRLKKLEAGEKIDWATAEAMALGSLMYQGHNVRISGEDVGRGTFSHRHVMLVDQKTNEMFVPLNGLKGGHGGKLEVANSILSEEAVLGFEYGMAIDNPNNLIIWEAQFGDFANGAQIIIDNFIVTGETKWMESNGLVILLPHGYEGAASEHSSCRIERFLQLCDSKETSPDGDNVNLHIVNPSTPAQYYHVLRRQIMRDFRKPLLVIAPKILLRLSAATSTHVDFQPGTHFKNVLGDASVNADQVRRVVLCSGKHYYNLCDERKAKNVSDTAIIRIESICPFPLKEIQDELDKYKNAKTFVWSQEEHRNMGAWNFVRSRFEYLIGKQILYCGRAVAPTTATGIGKIHKREAEEILSQTFKL